MSSGKLPDGARFATRAVHAGLRPDPHYGSVVPAIHQTSTFVQPKPGEYIEDFDYARTANPTRRALEDALGELEGGHATAFASGLAAESALITAVCEAGSHVVLPRDLYGGTYRLVDKVLARWGLRYDLVDQTDLDAVDNTFATPVNQRPLEHGADFVVHSLTKYLGGHSDTVAGAVIAADPEWGERLRFVQNAAGAIPGPFDCFLVHRGLRTLHLRMAASAENARAVVEFLRGRDDVSDVAWPGYSGMVSFRHPDAHAICTRTQVFTLAESLGGVESLIEVPQAMTHGSVEGSDAAVPADLVRLSCGVEDAADLVEDLRRALETR